MSSRCIPLPELWEFKSSRLPEIAEFYGVFEGERMVAGGMTFYFEQANVVHTQYLSADLSIRKYSRRRICIIRCFALLQQKAVRHCPSAFRPKITAKC